MTIESYNPDIDSRSRSVSTVSTASIPTAPEKTFSVSGYLKYVNVANPTAGLVTISIYDDDGVYFISFPLPPGSQLSFIGAHWVSKGLTWVASAIGLSGQMRMQ